MTTIHIDGGNPNACDTDCGPCACGAWHVMPSAEEAARAEAIHGMPVVSALAAGYMQAPKTLLKAAKDLRAAQRDYMLLRDRPEHDALRDLAGQRVAAEAAELDRAIEATEKRQLAPVTSIGQRVRDLGDPAFTPTDGAA